MLNLQKMFELNFDTIIGRKKLTNISCKMALLNENFMSFN